MAILKIDNSEFQAVGPSEFQLRVSHRLGQRDSVLCAFNQQLLLQRLQLIQALL